jgi:uncharacterized protein (TIGR00251 family)
MNPLRTTGFCAIKAPPSAEEVTCSTYFARFPRTVGRAPEGRALSPVDLSEKDGLVRFEVHAKPRAKKSKLLGPRETPGGVALDVAIAAPPVDGAANEELVRTLARALEVPRRQVVLLRGEGSTTKLVGIAGLTMADVALRLALAAAAV